MKDLIHFYRVDDLTKVRYFYEEMLGLTLYKDQKKCLIYDVFGLGKIGFCTHHPAQKNDHTCITFVYKTKEEVNEQFDKLKQLGLNPEEPSTNKTFNIYHFFVKDPLGLNLEFQVFL